MLMLMLSQVIVAVNAYSRGSQPACRKRPSACLREFATRSCDCSLL